MALRSRQQRFVDFLTSPLRALTLFEEDRWGLSSLRSERFDYVAREVIGACLDVGCGRNNVFGAQYLDPNGRGIDVFRASLNHVPEPLRDAELGQAFSVYTGWKRR